MESGATINVVQEPGLNPYYNGRYSWSIIFSALYLLSKVLILIIMEDTHGEKTRINKSIQCLS